MKTILLTLITIITLTSCNKDDDNEFTPTLPPVTQIGANTFGCKINGQIMVPRDSRVSQLGGAPTGITYSRSRPPLTGTNYDFIESIDRYTSKGGIAFKLPNIDTLGVGEYIVQDMVGGMVSTNSNIVYMGAISNGFYSSIADTGKIIITRYDNDVISGTFYCTLKNDYNSNDIIEVTEGRFDFNKNTINTTRFP